MGARSYLSSDVCVFLERPSVPFFCDFSPADSCVETPQSQPDSTRTASHLCWRKPAMQAAVTRGPSLSPTAAKSAASGGQKPRTVTTFVHRRAELISPAVVQADGVLVWIAGRFSIPRQRH